MTGNRIRLLLVLALLVSTLGLAAGVVAEGGGKVFPHEQPVGVVAEKLHALAYDSFNNPAYSYVPVQVPAAGVYYRQVANPDGSKIVAQKSWNDGAPDRDRPDGPRRHGRDSHLARRIGPGDIYGYMNPFWSDDGTVIGFAEVHNTTSNKIMRYTLATGIRDYLYQPIPPLDANNADFKQCLDHRLLGCRKRRR